MSRVIVKGVPGKLREEGLRELFSRCGEVTDVRLPRTRAGASRRFGFVGFSSDEQAETAVRQFDKTFIGAARICVEIARPYGDEGLGRPWSKYSKGSSAYLLREKRKAERLKVVQGAKEQKEGEFQQTQRLNQDQHRSKLSKLLGELYSLEEEDPDFQEFVAIHKHKSKIHTWADEEERGGEGGGGGGRGGGGTVRRKLSERQEEEKKVSEETEEDKEKSEDSESDGEEESPACLKATSDLDYLRTKMVKSVAQEYDNLREESSDSEEEEEEEEEGEEEMERENEMATTPYTIKMRGLPFTATDKDIHSFFHPIKVASIRFTVDNQGRPSGRAYVDVSSESDLKEALKRNGDCIGCRYIELFRDEGPQNSKPSSTDIRNPPKPWELKVAMAAGPGAEEDDESIAESGRLFVRNLPFSTTEEQLTELFEKFGPLTEATIPLDKTTNKPKGVAFITFMLPEHAVKAYEELDGQIFQGRLIHLLPGRSKQSGRERGGGEGGGGGGSSYKRKKEEKVKSQASSSHNWNSLFLGANAVVDAMADRYSTEKSDILDPESSHSVAVRMALGETQLVSETREFLVSQGVNLDQFEQARPKRSKTIILVKNLPFGTTNAELHKLFSPFGSVGHVVLPPAGVSALVEFLEPAPAKAAFSKLAYTKFKHLPLYLEWAPFGVLSKKMKEEGEKEKQAGEEEEEEEEGEGEIATLFVKGLDFSTTEEALTRHFSRIGPIKTASIAKKRNMKVPAHPLSMGFGFVQFASHELASKALKQMQHSELDGHTLELKLSHRETGNSQLEKKRRKRKKGEQTSAKILVRNVPFEASKREVKELFHTFGELKTVRLPKRLGAQGDHRGFGFVEFLTKEDTKRAFEAISHSTHLYGRRLVLEWAEEGESVESIRRKTAEHFHGVKVLSSKRRKVEDLVNFLDKTRSS